MGSIGGLEAVVEQGRWADGCHYHVLEAIGLDMASPHDLRHCKWARGGLTADLPQGRQSTGDSGQRIGAVERVGRERRTEGAIPVPSAGACVAGKQASPTSPTRGVPRSKAALGVIQAGWWTQEVANKAGIAEHPFCVKCEPAVLGSAQHPLWACPAYRETRFDLPPTH